MTTPVPNTTTTTKTKKNVKSTTKKVYPFPVKPGSSRPRRGSSSSSSTVKKRTSSHKEQPDGSVIIKIASFEEIKNRLEALGYTFVQHPDMHEIIRYYCRPNGNPEINPTAIENEDYFTSLQDFRKYLCQNGVECSDGQLPWDNGENGKETTEMIIDWVRYSILTTIDTKSEKEKRITYYPMEKKGIFGLLQEIKVVKLRGYDWVLRHNEKVRGPEEEIWNYLGKHGLPQEAKSKIEEKEELLALEVLIADVYEDKNKDTM